MRPRSPLFDLLAFVIIVSFLLFTLHTFFSAL